MAVARLLSAAAETDKELIAAPGAGKAIEIYGIHIASNAANTVSLYEDAGATLLHREYAQTPPPLGPGSQALDVLTVAKNLSVTSTNAVAMFIKVIYRVVSV